MGVAAPQLYAVLEILDATLTPCLPTGVAAATGIDAMVQAVEACTRSPTKNAMSYTLARQALELLSTQLLTACEDGKNLQARQAMLLRVDCCFAANRGSTHTPTRLRHVGIGESYLDRHSLLGNNSPEVSREGARATYATAL